MAIRYKSTRSLAESVSSAEAILQGIASDKGLYVPMEFPVIDKSFNELANMTYQEIALYIFKKYLGDFEEIELKDAVDKAYDDKFDTPEIAPIAKKSGAYFLELYHGKTIAFKDMALSILPHLMTKAAKKLGEEKEIVILTATSGDTGKAALEGFADVKNTKIIVFYPAEGVSEIQKRQMITQEGDNTYVVGIKGNFDDAQRGVKQIFNDKKLNEKLHQNGYLFSSANSINIGRLIPQVVYYVYTYAKLIKEEEIREGEKINFVVPTGNFGNILAAYYAKQMGLPVNKLICASNENNVLTDFINTGVYDINRKFMMTTSPSMDILISSNLERLLYEIANRDPSLVQDMMNRLDQEKKYEITSKMKEGLKDFYGEYATDAETLSTIQKVYEESKYVIDTHTAVAYNVYEKYKQATKDGTKTVIVSTASPFKFTKSVADALIKNNQEENEFKLIEVLADFAKIPVPKVLQGIGQKDILHKRECEKQEMEETVKNILGL
jgi:threonine synthase